MKKKLLNLGCGNCFHEGWINLDFVSNNNNVTAYDLSLGIPFHDNEFDVVYHSHLLEHFSREQAAEFIKECYRVLKPNGILRVVVPDLEKIARIYLEKLEERNEDDYDWIMLELYDQTTRDISGGDMYKYFMKKNIPNLEFVLSRIGKEGEGMIDSIRHMNETGKNNLKNNIKNRCNFFTKMVRFIKIGKFRMSGEIHRWMYDRFSLGRLLAGTGFKRMKVVDGFTSGIEDFSSYGLDVVENKTRKPDSLFMEAVK